MTRVALACRAALRGDHDAPQPSADHDRAADRSQLFHGKVDFGERAHARLDGVGVGLHGEPVGRAAGGLG